MKKTIATITLAAIMTFGSTFANAGIIVAGKNADNGCQGKDGIIVAGLTGIIVAGLTGIIVAGVTADTTPNPTVCTTDKDGIIVAG